MIKAEYIDHMGSDLRVVNAARVSFNKESQWIENCSGCPGDGPCPGCPATRGILCDKDRRLIRYLALHDHWTPFAHCMITLRETVPIFVARQRFKHMVGFTYNEVSRRYVDDEPEFYEPEVWRKRAEDKKQGSSEETLEPECLGLYTDGIGAYYENALALYENMLAEGVAPEQARMVLPQSMLTSYYVTGSLAAFARAYKQRIDPHAQSEIQDLARQWDEVIRPLFPVSWEALACTS